MRVRVARVSGWVANAAALVVALALSIALGAPRALATEEVVVQACDADLPDGWQVLDDASGASEFNVLCNFLVTREVDGATFVSGIAITVEYFCAAADAKQAFLGKTGQRDTETQRTPTKVVFEEGPDSPDPDNPRLEPIIGFGPELYGLSEKAFELLTPQMVSTTVVLTNERNVAAEDERFGVDLAKPQIITVANNHRPDSCDIAAVGGATGGGGGGGGGKGGGPGRVLVGGVAGVVAVGGVVVWRRRRGRVVKRPPSGIGDVPPPCIAHAEAFEKSRETLLTLREAFQDMSDDLFRAQKNHQNNIVKIHMIMGFEAGQIAGSTVGDLANMLRPKVRVSGGQADTWKPPGGLDARMAAALHQAQEMLERLLGRIGDLKNRLAQVTSQLAHLGSHPALVELQQQAQAALSAIGRAEQGLAASTAARSALDALDGNIEAVSRAAARNFTPVEALEGNIARFRGFISQAEDDIAKLTRTVDGANPLAPVADSRELLSKRSQLEGMQRQLDRDLAELATVKANHQDSLRNLDQLMKQRDEAMAALSRAGDVTPADLDRLRGAHQRIVEQTATKQQQLMGDLSRQYESMQAQLKASEVERSLAEAYLNGLRSQIDRAGAAAQPGLARRVLHETTSILTLPLVPVMKLWEAGFGSVQSVPEAFEILLRGERRITEMTHHLTMVERAVDTTRARTERFRVQLDQCVKAASMPAPRAPSPSAA